MVHLCCIVCTPTEEAAAAEQAAAAKLRVKIMEASQEEFKLEPEKSCTEEEITHNGNYRLNTIFKTIIIMSLCGKISVFMWKPLLDKLNSEQ